ncbi:hypothetical protein GO003_005945 [Methylicorpusculum oleiharenae]|uniref:hypothetical protein n=1 Tax=Methylicorpusculum oleiharenae TaxID=1338687 RepID=UPI001357C1F9|nr:hypothetical protein [Methylicorpusculum oleiharenae]MCD2449926.1 hypothetical protein [Methylicorpusculum oleiharenae]
MQRNHFFLRDQYQPGGRQLLAHTLQQGAAVQHLGASGMRWIISSTRTITLPVSEC